MTTAFEDQKVPMMTSADNVGPGWHPLIRDLEKELNEISPEFELFQVKEKFGGLRYYAQPEVGTSNDQFFRFRQLIQEAETKSTTLCEECGEPASTDSFGGWYKTLCQTHAAERREK